MSKPNNVNIEKKVVTFYWSLERGYEEVTFHISQKDAIEYFKDTYKIFFPGTVLKDELPEESLEVAYRVGHPHRNYNIDFLDNHPVLEEILKEAIKETA